MRNSPNRAESHRGARGRHPSPAHADIGVLTQAKVLVWGKRGEKGDPNSAFAVKEEQHLPALAGRSRGGSEMPELPGGAFPRAVPASPGENQEGPPGPPERLSCQPPGAFGAARIGCQGTARLRSKAMQNPTPAAVTWRHPGRGEGGLQATSYSLRAGNSASFYQTPHQSFYISPPSAGSAQTLHPLPGSRTPCASCSAPVTFRGGWDTEGGVGEGSGDEVGGRSNRKQNRKRTYNEGFPAKGHVLTPYRLNRISRSSLPLRYLSSIKGLWSMESSPSGSGLSQPLKPFFLNV